METTQSGRSDEGMKPFVPLRPIFWAALVAVFVGCCVAQAQERPKTGGSPLDTLLSTRLWADVPEAKDFVRQSRPASDALDYQPTSGTEIERPGLKTKAELEAMQSELEGAAARNGARTGQRPRAKPASAAQSAKAREAKQADKGAVN